MPYWNSEIDELVCDRLCARVNRHSDGVMVEVAQSLVVILGVIVVSSWPAVQILRLLRINVPYSQVLGMSLLFGGTLTSILALVLRSFEVANEIALLMIAAIGMMVRIVIDRRVGVSNIGAFEGLNLKLVFRAIGLALIGLHTFAMWSMVLGVGLIAATYLCKADYKFPVVWKLFQLLALVVIGVVAAQLIRAQPNWWHSETNDTPFFEALSWSLVSYGPRVHPGLVDGSVVGYHYLAYLWSGEISDFSSARSFHVLNVVMPFLQCFSIALVLIEPRQAAERIPSTRDLLTLSLILANTSTSFTSFSMATWSLTCYTVLLFSEQERSASWNRGASARQELLLAIFGSLTVLAKGTALPIVLALGLAKGVTGLSACLTSSGRSLRSAFPFHLVLVCGVATWWYYGLIFGTSLLSSEDLSPVSAVSQLGLSEGLWISRDIFSVAPVLLIIGAISFYSYFFNLKCEEDRHQLTISLFCLLVAGVVMLSPEIDAREYVYEHALIALSICSLTAVTWNNVPRFFKQSTLIALVISIFGSWIEIYLLPTVLEFLWSGDISRWIPMVLTVARLPIAITVFIAFVLISAASSQTNFSKRRLSGRHLPVMALSCLSINLGAFSLVNRFEQLPAQLATNPNTTSSPFHSAHPDDASMEVGEWVRSFTPRDSILATNSFCCAGVDWLETAVQQIRSNDLTADRENAFGGANYQLVAVTQRRFLLAGPRFIIGGKYNPEDVAGYLELSVLFGATGSSRFASELRELGVSYFIFDRLALGIQPYPGFIEPLLYQNQRFWVLDLTNRQMSPKDYN